MTSLREAVRRFFIPAKPLPPGTYHYQAPADAPSPYRLHLRLEKDGSGILILNASTVLHLNPTAAEFVYHIIKQTPEDQVARSVAARYLVKYDQALDNFHTLAERIDTLITTPDLDPATFLDFGREEPNSGILSAPYRLVCALTYRTTSDIIPGSTPVERVSRELLTGEWQTILEKAWNAGIPHILFTGGEPTTRPDLPDLITFCEKLGQVTGLLTDGLRLSETFYLHELLQSGLDHVMLVMDPEEDQAWEALRDTLAEDLFTTVHLTLTEENQSQISPVLEQLHEKGVTSLSLSANSSSLSDELHAARQQAAELGLTLVWDMPVPYSGINPVALELSGNQLPEGGGKAWLYVEPDGDVLPAQGVNKVLGNLLTDSWEDIWQRAKSEN